MMLWPLLLHSALYLKRAAAADTLTYTSWQKKKHQAAVFDLITKEEGIRVGEFSILLVFFRLAEDVWGWRRKC
jgi:hypothetical protein